MALSPGFIRRRRAAAERQRDYKEVFSTEAGKRVLKDLCDRCGVFSPISADNPHSMAWMEGRRESAMDILRTLAISEAVLMTLYEEMENERLDEYGRDPSGG